MPTPIVAFAKDWHEDPTSNHHVLRELAKTRRVLWLNSLATRTPKLGSARDLGKIRRKLGEFAAGPVNVENDLQPFGWAVACGGEGTEVTSLLKETGRTDGISCFSKRMAWRVAQQFGLRQRLVSAARLGLVPEVSPA